MKQPISYSKIEKELLSKFRKQVSQAETTEDMKRFFGYSIQELLSQVFSGKLSIGEDDIALNPENKPPFTVAERLQANDDFTSIWETSDLPNIVSRFAEAAMHRSLHLAKNLKKTEAKIRM